MSLNYRNRAQLTPIIVLIFLVSISLISCKAHDKAIRIFKNTIRAEVEQFNDNTNLEVGNSIITIGKMIKSPSVTEILSDKDELIATQ